jgi:hypothetical protein
MKTTLEKQQAHEHKITLNKDHTKIVI